MLVVTGNVACTSSTGSVVVECIVHTLQHMRVTTHTEIVIGTPDGHSVLRGGHMCPRKLLGQTVDIVEVAVGLVLELFVQLASVEALIVEFRSSRWDSWLGTSKRLSRTVQLLNGGSRRDRDCYSAVSISYVYLG